MNKGKRLDKWFYERVFGERVDLCPEFSTKWEYVNNALEPIFTKYEVDEFNVFWDECESLWQCEIIIENEELTTIIKKQATTPLAAIISASGELIGQLTSE